MDRQSSGGHLQVVDSGSATCAALDLTTPRQRMAPLGRPAHVHGSPHPFTRSLQEGQSHNVMVDRAHDVKCGDYRSVAQSSSISTSTERAGCGYLRASL